MTYHLFEREKVSPEMLIMMTSVFEEYALTSVFGQCKIDCATLSLSELSSASGAGKKNGR